MGSNGSVKVASPVSSSGAGSWVETNGINQIAENERGGRPRDLFWPWFAGNVSVFSISNGSFVIGFGISFWQSIAATMLGVVASYLLCGIIAVAGKRASAPTMTISRSIYGVRGNAIPSALSWLLTVGWETALVSVAALATGTILRTMGWEDTTAAKLVVLALIVMAVAIGGLLGFGSIMKIQRWITWTSGILTLAYLALASRQINFESLAALPSGRLSAFVGATLFVMSGFGLGWVNSAADYSRYLPRASSGRSVAAWTVFGSSLGPLALITGGVLLAGSSRELGTRIASDPVGALATVLPAYLLLPFLAVTILGLVGGAIMNIYSSGFCLLNAGLRGPRWLAVIVDSILVLLGSLFVVFDSPDFLVPFQGFLITLGVPIAAWCGTFLADFALRDKDYEPEEFLPTPRRSSDIKWMPIAVVTVSTFLGWGLVTNNSATWLGWQGYFLGAAGLGGKEGSWADANLGVFCALLFGFLGYLGFSFRIRRSQEHSPN